MKWKNVFICSCLFFALVGQKVEAVKNTPVQKLVSSKPQGTIIRVLLEKDVNSALLEAKGEYSVVSKETGSVLSFGSQGKRFVVHALQEGLRWGEEYPGVYRIVITPDSPSTRMYVNGIQYTGAIAVYHAKNNKILVVNEVPIEDYLKSTLSVQFEKGISKEAMAAIAIAARTNAYSLVQNATRRPWDVLANESKYFGASVTYQKNGVEEAVDWTRFMVMENKNGDQVLSNIEFSSEKVKELADRGLDAKKILQNICPEGKLGVTNKPKAIIR